MTLNELLKEKYDNYLMVNVDDEYFKKDNIIKIINKKQKTEFKRDQKFKHSLNTEVKILFVDDFFKTKNIYFYLCSEIKEVTTLINNIFSRRTQW